MTTFTVDENSTNYAAQVIEVKAITTLANLDNLVGISTGGFQALVPKTTQVGDVLVVFPAESQLSEAFASANNLFRHVEQNADPSAPAGYLEDNRRVRAIRLRGERSSALAMDHFHITLPAEVLAAGRVDDIPVGTQFTHINGVEIVRKYELPVKAGSLGKSQQEKAWKRVDSKMLPEHIDTENYFRNSHKIGPDEHITVTQKIHGTSIRLANTIVKRKPTWFERLVQRFGVKVATTEFDTVFGSRKVIKDPHNPAQDHFYAYDIWTTEGEKYEHLIPKNVVIYGELIGWTKDGAPIQAGYTYDVPKGEAHLYVYRVAFVSEDGGLYDLSWEGVKEFSRERGLKHVPELWSGLHSEFRAEGWLDKVYSDEYLYDETVNDGYTDPRVGYKYPQALPLSKPGSVDEGVVVRAEGILPRVFKAKSPVFLEHETKLLDKGVEVLS